ncbi:MAG: response regulator [Archangium sp.]|nr:response regulator [Archangium sp.]
MSSAGKVLILGARASGLAERLQARGYVCETALASAPLDGRPRPDVIVLATPTRGTPVALQRIRQHGPFRAIPVLVDGTGAAARSKTLSRLDVDGVARSIEELELQLAASVRARRATERESLVRHRLELLLEITRSRQRFDELVPRIAGSLQAVLGADQVVLLTLEGEVPRRAFLVDRSTKTPVDVAVTPTLRRALETREPVEADGTCVYPLSGETGVVALVLKRQGGFERDERDFVNAVGAALTHTRDQEVAQAAIAKTRESLERAYVERYRELVEANQRFKLLDRRKNELLAVLSHDLRTPLNVLLGHAWILLDDAALTETNRRSADAIQRTSKKVLELVENVLDKSRADDGRMPLFTKTMDVAETCQEAVRELHILASKRGIKLRVEAPVSLMVLGDELKIQQVLQNLLSNALAHAKDATEVVVRARRITNASGHFALVEVKDDGRVANPSELVLAFEHSTGFGLGICRDFVERHGGHIWAEAPDGGGALFSFTLPLEIEAPSANQRLQRDTPVVLLVDDDSIFARICSMGLAGHYRVEVARDGDEALARVSELKPDVIVMDVFMPNRDGLEALRALQANPQTAHIPVVLISAQPEMGEQLRAVDVGAVDYLTKPFPLGTLLTKVNAALQRTSVVSSVPPGNDRETGLFDQLGVVTRLEQEMSRSVRYGRPLSLIVLRPSASPGAKVPSLAGLVRSELRSPEVAAHLGQGVFAVVLPEVAVDQATAVAASLRARLDEEGHPYTSRVASLQDDSPPAERVLEQLLS